MSQFCFTSKQGEKLVLILDTKDRTSCNITVASSVEGFVMVTEPQVRSICNHVRPDRQTLLFSATFKKRVERLARDVLTDPVRIVQGDVGEANTDVTQARNLALFSPI